VVELLPVVDSESEAAAFRAQHGLIGRDVGVGTIDEVGESCGNIESSGTGVPANRLVDSGRVGLCGDFS
jgi:hypothetical protein